MIRSLILSVVLATSLVATASADTLVASWNMLHLGSKAKDEASMVRIVSSFDLVAAQEVMSIEAVEALRVGLSASTGEVWNAAASLKTGRHSYKEHYAFFWRQDAIYSASDPLMYEDPGDLFERNPFSMRFVDKDGFAFVFAQIHSIYGKTKERREAEARTIAEYYQWLQRRYPETPIIMVGDFNLPPTNPAWKAMAGVARPLITEGATTLSTKEGQFANLYDNIWVPLSSKRYGLAIRTSGIYEFPADIGVTHEEARKSISDHAPVFAVITTE